MSKFRQQFPFILVLFILATILFPTVNTLAAPYASSRNEPANGKILLFIG